MQGLQCRNTVVPMLNDAVSHPAAPVAPTHVAPVVGRYRRPWLFFALATAIPWALWLLAGALSRQGDHPVLVALLALAGLCAPIAVAFAMVWPDAVLRADVWRRLTNVGEVRWWAWAVAVLVLPGALLLGTGISLGFGYSPDQFLFRDGYSFTGGGLVPAWLTLALAPVLEELAWHSYGTDALASRWTVLRSSLVFGVIWFLWHVPLATIEGLYQAEVVETGWLASLNFGLSVFPFVILMNWVYYRSGRNILLTMLFHLVANFGNELWQTHPDTKVIQTAILLVVCVVVVWRDRELFLTRPGRAIG